MTSLQKAGRVLVTGATGFLGTAVVPRLVGEGYRVTALGRKARPSGLRESIEYISADLAAPGAAGRLKPFPWDAVVHLAGAAPKSDLPWDENVDLIAAHVRSATALMSALPGEWPGRLVHASGFIVYGQPIALPVPESQPRRPLHGYALAKMLAEDVILARPQGTLDRWVLRLAGLFSPSRRSGALFNFAAAARARRELRIDATRMLPWDVLHVDDATEMIVRALQAPALDPGALNASYGEEVDLASMARRIVDRAQTGALVTVSGSAPPVRFRLDTSRMRALIGPLAYTLDERLDELLATVGED